MAPCKQLRRLLWPALAALAAGRRTEDLSATLLMDPNCEVDMFAEPLPPAELTAELLRAAQEVCVKQSGEGHKGGVLFVQLDGRLAVVKAAVTAADAVAAQLGVEFGVPMPQFAAHALDSPVMTAFKEVLDRAQWETDTVSAADWAAGAEEGFAMVFEMLHGGSYASLGKVAKECMLKTTKIGREYSTDVDLCGLGPNDALFKAKAKYQRAVTHENLKRLAKIAAMDMLLMEWDQMTAASRVPIDPPKIGNMENIMYRVKSEQEWEAVAIDFAVASWGSAQCVYQAACGPGTEMDDKIGEGFTNAFLSPQPVEPVYRARLQKLLRYPAMSTTDFKNDEFKDIYRFFPMMDPLTDEQYSLFASTVLATLRDTMTTAAAEEAADAWVDRTPGAKDKVQALIAFVKGRMRSIREAGEAKRWGEGMVRPAATASYYSQPLEDGERLGWRQEVLVWSQKGQERGTGTANAAVNAVLSQSRSAGGEGNLTAKINNGIMAAFKDKQWTCHADIVHEGKVYPTRYLLLGGKVQGCSDNGRDEGRQLSQPCAADDLGERPSLPSGSCSKPWTCSESEKQDDMHWCYKAVRHFEGAKQDAIPWANDLHGYALLLDLGKLRARVSDRATMDPRDEVCPLDGEYHDRLFSTYEFAGKVNAEVAVNANFFVNAMNVHEKTCARPYGLCMHEGNVQHRPGELGFEDPNDKPRQEHGLNPKGRVSVLFDNEAGKVKAMEGITFPLNPQTGNRNATTGSFREGVAGNWLVKDGIALNQLELNPVPVDKEARSAIGWVEGEDGTASRLLLVVVEKKAYKEHMTLMPDPGLPLGMEQVASGGISLVELADIMLALGVTTAVNLDGGGSSNVCMRSDSEGGHTCSVPSDYHIYAPGTPGVEDSNRAVYKFRHSPCQLGFVQRSTAA